MCVATFSSSSMCTEEGGSHRIPPCDRPRPGVDIARGGGGGASESARGDSALLGTRKRSKFPFAKQFLCLGPFLLPRCFSLPSRCRLVEPSAPGSLLAARSGRSDSRTRLPIHSAPCGTGRRTQRRHTRGSGSRDGGGQTGRGRARRRGRGGCAERTRRVHRAELHERRAREGCDRGASRETAPNASARSRRAIGVSPRRRASSAREIRLSIWNSTWNDEPTIHSHVRVVRGDVRFSRRSMFATAWARLTDASRDSPSTRPTRVRSCARCRKRARRSISTRSTRTWRRRSRKGTTRGTRVRA